MDNIDEIVAQAMEAQSNNAASNTAGNTSADPIDLTLDQIRDPQGVSRFKGASWFNLIARTNITVVGLGGIGSNAALLLSRLRPAKMSVIDFDLVDASNLAGQFYFTNDVEKFKTEAITERIQSYSSYWNIDSRTERVTEAMMKSASGVVVCGFDNMEARKNCYLWAKENPKISLFIDARLNAESWQLFALTQEDLQSTEYEKYLFADSEVEDAACSYKQTTYAAMMLASMISNVVINYADNVAGHFRSLPKRLYWNSYSMMLDYYECL